MIALSAPSGAIIPLPVPLSVKPGSVKVLSDLHPALSDAVRYRTKGLEARLLVPPIGAWDQEPLPLQKLIFPSFKKGAKAEALRVSAFDAVERLLSERIWLGDPITEERAIRLFELACMKRNATPFLMAPSAKEFVSLRRSHRDAVASLQRPYAVVFVLAYSMSVRRRRRSVSAGSASSVLAASTL